MTALVFEKLTQSLAAGEVWKLLITANFARIAGAAGPVTLRLYRNGVMLGQMSDVQAGDYVRDVEFDALEIVNGANSQAVTVQIAGGGVGSDRVLGEVSVIDGGKFRTLAARSFSGGHSFTPGAGEYGHVLLANPAGSGLRAVVEGFSGMLGTRGHIVVKLGSGAPGTLIRQAGNKLGGGAASVCQVREYKAGSVYSGTEMYTSLLPADTPAPVWPKTPVIVRPGSCLVLVGIGTNVAMTGWFDFYEEADA